MNVSFASHLKVSFLLLSCTWFVSLQQWISFITFPSVPWTKVPVKQYCSRSRTCTVGQMLPRSLRCYDFSCPWAVNNFALHAWNSEHLEGKLFPNYTVLHCSKLMTVLYWVKSCLAPLWLINLPITRTSVRRGVCFPHSGQLTPLKHEGYIFFHIKCHWIILLVLIGCNLNPKSYLLLASEVESPSPSSSLSSFSSSSLSWVQVHWTGVSYRVSCISIRLL